MFKEGMLALVGLGFIETIYMTVISTVLAYIIGLPLGLVLVVTDKDGIHPIPWLNSLLGMIINFFRSIPFLILLIALMPFTKMVVGILIHQPDGKTVTGDDAAHQTRKESIEFAVIDTIVMSIFIA